MVYTELKKPKMINKKSRIFVTGHKGLVGSAIIRRLNFFGFNKIITVEKESLI